MGETAPLWDAMNEVKERLTRLEEQSKHRGEQVDKIGEKVDELHKLAIEAQAAGKTAMMFGKWGYGLIGAAAAFVAAKWAIIAKALSP